MISAVRTTLDIDEDVLQAAKELAALRGATAGKVLSELARQGLRAGSTDEIPVRNGVPLITRSGSPGAAKPTMTRVNALRDEA